MKKLLLLLLIVSALTFSGCGKSNKDALAFKEDYESINGVQNSHGFANRTISISEDNKFAFIKPSEIVKKIKNKETFYIYFGSKLCPWCRSVIEKADEVSRNKKIDKIYYVDIWDEEGNEIFRDKYELIDGKLTETYKGIKEYKYILNAIDKDLLRDYTLVNSDGDTIDVGEKRIYAPNFVYFKNGKAIRLVTGKSDKQTDPREKLSKEILKDEEDTFNKFFK